MDTDPKIEYKRTSKFKRFISSDGFSIFFIIALSLTILVTKGEGRAGQSNFFNTLLHEYVGDTAAYHNPDSLLGLIDINSLSATNPGLGGGDGDYLGTIQGNSLLSHNAIITDLEEITSERNEIITYTVRPGDVLSLIARDFGVSTNSLIWANSLRNADSIKPDQILKIPPVSGVVHTVSSGDTVSSLASKYGADIDEIIDFNALPKDGALQVGADIIIPGGEIQTIPAGTAGVRYARTVPFANLPKLVGYFFHPTGGLGRMSQWIHGRNGIDVANSCGTTVFAAANGTIALARASGWNGGFGRMVKISHSNGTATLYAHLWGVLVSQGQTVVKGQKIATIGSTGRSTGCHLHFEVHGAQNPLQDR